jgi:hypothetical protein
VALKNAVQAHQGKNGLHRGLEMNQAEGASAPPDIVEAPYQRREARTVNLIDPFEVNDKVAAALGQ